MVQKRRSVIITMLLPCLIFMGYAVKGYSQQESNSRQSPAAQKPAKTQNLPERPRRYPTALAGLEVIADLSVSPSTHTGSCPALFRFTGKITVNKAATVQYRFVRSDNTRMPPAVLTFEEAGTQEVTDTWQFEDATSGSTFTGWEAIQINFPMKVQSNVAIFRGTCTGQGKRVPEKSPMPKTSPQGPPVK